jgi:AcrR family transcriptional regulator
MPRTGLSPDALRARALDVAETLIRRQGAAQTRLVDIARELAVSHPALYRLFPDKAALIDAVSGRWLERIDAELATIVARKTSARARLHAWFLRLYRLKRAKVALDPELYRAFDAAADLHRPVVVQHLRTTMAQLVAIVASGIDSREFARQDASALAELLFTGMIAFHHPKLVLDQLATSREAPLKRLLEALIDGAARPTSV